ncbi:MAG: alanine racemase [Oscillospiraceae bacterium]|nr:alanine racemase [Oscillospiraceae bacterium]
MLKKTTAFISLKNIEHNLNVVKSHLSPKTEILSVVKSDAYGHGVVEVSKKLYTLGVRYFGVACLSEALELREALPDAEILIFGFTHPSDAEILSNNNITQALYGTEFAKQLSENAQKCGRAVKTHLAFDTGMGRIGFKDANEAISAAKLSGIEVLGAFTHFSCADKCDDGGRAYTENQYKKFCSFLKNVEDAGIKIGLRHCSNSAAVFRYPEFQMDMVRVGIALYGLCPNPQDKQSYKGLKPAMQLKAPISHIKWVNKGDSISYGAAFTAEKDMRIATLPCGYADGYHRALGAGSVSISGRRAKIVGRICMDQMMIDVTDIPAAQFLSEAELLGSEITADELAELIGTINYQVACDISKRVERVYE